jgi:hypothetical protein
LPRRGYRFIGKADRAESDAPAQIQKQGSKAPTLSASHDLSRSGRTCGSSDALFLPP